MTLRIGLDHRKIASGEGTGVQRYRDNVRAALAAQDIATLDDGAPRNPTARLIAAISGHCSATGWASRDVFRIAQTCFTLTGRMLRVTLPNPPAIFHWSSPLPIWIAGIPNIYTVHDLIPVLKPSLTAMSGKRTMRLLRAIADQGAAVVTVSETVTRDLEPLIGGSIPVTCCYAPVTPPADHGALPPGLQPGGYFLCIGRVETRKNIARLITAHRQSGAELPLVIAGPDGHWASAADERAVAGAVDGVRVIRLPWVDDASAAALIRNSKGLLMPSLAEGFGLPIVEAMMAGVPVLTSDRGATAEIAGSAALLVDPDHIGSIARGISTLDSDDETRDHLIRDGSVRARDFTANAFASRIMPVYDAAIREYKAQQ